MPITDPFPVKVLLQPEAAFSDLAAGRRGWGWPLGVYALSICLAALLFTLLPPQYLADSLEGFSLSRDRGFFYYFPAALAGGLALTLFLSALVSALARFLGGGRLSVRLAGAAALIGAFGLLAAALHGAEGGRRAAGLAAAAAAALFAGWAGYSDRKNFPALLKCLLSVSGLALAGDLCGAAAALAGSVRAYTAAEYLFAVLSLYWSAKAVAAVYGAAKARAAAAVVLGAFGAMAFLFLALNTGLLPEGLFEALLLV